MEMIFKNTNEREIELVQKLPYESPEISIIMVELEYSIAAGSALVMPENQLNDEVLEEWYVDPDDEHTVNW